MALFSLVICPYKTDRAARFSKLFPEVETNILSTMVMASLPETRIMPMAPPDAVAKAHIV